MPCFILGILENKEYLTWIDYESCHVTTKLIIICVIRVTIYDKTWTCVNASYNRRNKKYGLHIFIQVNTLIHL